MRAGDDGPVWIQRRRFFFFFFFLLRLQFDGLAVNDSHGRGVNTAVTTAVNMAACSCGVSGGYVRPCTHMKSV